MNFRVVIPARYAATRLPGKPLRLLGGVPIVARVWAQAQASGAAQVVVATDDVRIAEVIHAVGGEVCLTASTLASGTDRVCAAAEQLGWQDEAVIVNLQGDEPFMPPALIRQVAELLACSGCPVATLATPLAAETEFAAPQIVKVVTDQQGRALYFSRAPIPHPRAGGGAPVAARRHLGLYAYRLGPLRQFVRWPVAPLEQLEQLEQLRWLWHGQAIAVADSLQASLPGIDTPEDLAQAERRLAHSA